VRIDIETPYIISRRSGMLFGAMEEGKRSASKWTSSGHRDMQIIFYFVWT
jgi:hypothetical protein